MDKNQFFKKDALRPTGEQRLLTKQFYQKVNIIHQLIPLYLEMTYSINGIASELAPDPVWLGSFIQTTINHPELFQFQCPQCGKTILPYRYTGSPLSGRVDLEGCCDCGWKGFESVSGWFKRGEALREQIDADKARHLKYMLFHPKTEPETINGLLSYLLKKK